MGTHPFSNRNQHFVSSYFNFFFSFIQALPQLADRDKVVDIIDPTLEGQYSTKEVVQVAAIAAMCVQAEADYRPLMADVVQSLAPLVRSRRSASKLSGCSSSFSLARSPNSPGKASVSSQ